MCGLAILLDIIPLKRYTVSSDFFEVKSDFWDWEMPLDGIETVREMLSDLKGG